jgi:hypothetical protein
VFPQKSCDAAGWLQQRGRGDRLSKARYFRSRFFRIRRCVLKTGTARKEPIRSNTASGESLSRRLFSADLSAPSYESIVTSDKSLDCPDRPWLTPKRQVHQSGN